MGGYFAPESIMALNNEKNNLFFNRFLRSHLMANNGSIRANNCHAQPMH